MGIGVTKVIIRKNWNDTEKISMAPGARMTRINREVYRNFFFTGTRHAACGTRHAARGTRHASLRTLVLQPTPPSLIGATGRLRDADTHQEIRATEVPRGELETAAHHNKVGRGSPHS